MLSQESFLINLTLIATYLIGILIARYTKYEHNEIKEYLLHVKKITIIITTFMLLFKITTLSITLIITIIIALIISLLENAEINNVISWLILITINTMMQTPIEIVMMLALIIIMTGIQDEIKYLKKPINLSVISATRIIGIIITSIITII